MKDKKPKKQSKIKAFIKKLGEDRRLQIYLIIATVVILVEVVWIIILAKDDGEDGNKKVSKKIEEVEEVDVNET